MDSGLALHKYVLSFVVAGIIALVGFASGDISFGFIGLAVIALLGGRLATKLAVR